MKFELKDYQEQAASKVLSGLLKGSAEYAADRTHTAVSLSAPTGAGKTVIAAAVIERILFGDPEGDRAGNPDAVFVWLTDDPSLNEQTRKKLLEASDRIQPGQLVVLDDGFDEPRLPAGKVMFLNIQKLGRNSNLTTRREGRRRNTLWDTISATIAQAGENYYLVIDEAHRGTGRQSRDTTTITQRLMNGDDGVKAAPVVLGISATPQRFDDAVAVGATERVPRRVIVPSAAVRESGLIKDVLAISYRGERQTMDFTLLRDAVANLRKMDTAWNAYTTTEDTPAVRPALVLQIPPNASTDDVGGLLDVCVSEWDVLGHRHAIAHALETHTAQQFGTHAVPYVKPQDIQDHPAVRLVVFKEALTTGWDCPRAEVMVSLRTARDDTYIAQLIGRMVRSPLARRIASDETLNRVRLYLPQFDKAAVEAVKTKLESDDGGLPTDIETNSVDARRNKTVPVEVFDVVSALPSYQVPGPIHRSQVARLHKLAALFVGDELLDGAITAADEHLVGVLDAERQRLDTDGTLAGLIADARTATVEVLSIAGGETRTEALSIATDARDVERLFAGARRRLRDGLADIYWGWRITNHGDDPQDAKMLTLALSMDTIATERVEDLAAERVRTWLDTHGDTISGMSEDKKARYAEVRAMARTPEQVTVGLPTGAITMPGDTDTPSYTRHLYSDASGAFRARLGTWETHVLEVEQRRTGFTAWYRNPGGGQRALRVPFSTQNGYGKLYPDFVFVHRGEDGALRASIIDPHGHHLADAPDKLRGLAGYAQTHGGAYGRVSAVIKNAAGDFRVLDLKDPTVAAAASAVASREDIEQVFAAHGSAYQ